MQYRNWTIQRKGADNKPVNQPGAVVSVFDAGTTTLATGVVDANGTATNPLTADANGQVIIGAPGPETGASGLYDLSAQPTDGGAAILLPSQQFTDVVALAGQVADDATATAADRVQTGLDAAGAAAAAAAADVAAQSAQNNKGTYPDTASALSDGVAALTALVAGSGGTPGTYDLGFSGGAGSNASGWFVVAGDGTVSDYGITYPGYGYTSAPTVSFAAASGLTGASATAVLAQNAPAGAYFSIPDTDDSAVTQLWQNVSGTATDTGKRTPSNEAVQSVLASAPLSSGDVYSEVTFVGSIANGAVNNGTGLTIPSGQTGAGSFVGMNMPFDPTGLVGRRIRLTMLFTTSADAFALTWNKHMYRVVGAATTNNVEVSGSAVLQQLSSTVGRYDIDYIVIGTETALRPYLQRSVGAGVAGADITWQLDSMRWQIVSDEADSTTGSDVMFERRTSSAIAAALVGVGDDQRITQGAVESARYAFTGQALNGAALITDAAGNKIGLSVPSGSTGASAVLTYYTNFGSTEIAALVGRSLKFTLILTTSDNIASVKPFRSAKVNVQLADGSVRTAQGTQSATTMLDDTTAMIEYTYVVVGDEVNIAPVVGFATAAGNSGVDVSFQLDEFGYELVAVSSQIESTNDQNLALRITRALASVPSDAGVVDDYVGAVTVAVDGSADFTSIEDALDSITSATATAKWKVIVKPGVDTNGNFYMKDFVDVIGTDRYRSILSVGLPNDASAEDITNYTAFWLRTTTKIESMTLKLVNGRYTVHADNSNSVKDGHWEINDCYVEHFGNDDAVNNTWTSQNAIGIGTSSGQTISCRGSTFVGPVQGFAWHTNKKFEKPSLVDLRECSFAAKLDGGYAIGIRALGSLQTDLGYINDCQIDGDIHYNWVPWYPTDLESQPANHAEVRVMGAGNSPAVFTIVDGGRSLKIESASISGTSTIDVSGDAVSDLFGEVYSMPGDGGIPGYVYGWADISGAPVGLNQDTVITKLGQRLGDCSSTSKTLSVTIDGGTPIDIVFSVDYTASDNASILAIINGALGSDATASEYAIGERYRPQFFDEEKSLINGSSDGIVMGMGCAYDPDHKHVRAMTSADDASLFAGIAWEDIYPGKNGRVKYCGYVAIADVLRTDSATFGFGDGFSIDASAAGKWVKGGTQNLLTGIRSDAVRVGSAKR